MDLRRQRHERWTVSRGQVEPMLDFSFDRHLSRTDGEEDRHDQTFPYLDGKNPRPEFLRGKIVGTGTKMIDVVSVDYTWDSVLTKKAVVSGKRKR